VLIEDQLFDIQYEVSKDIDGWFDLTIWYEGKSIKERVPSYSSDRESDVKEAHAPMLLGTLIKRDKNS
jgi:hypothetical protein